jgi:hypothetical protein
MNRVRFERLALATLFTILSGVILFHVLILCGVIPYDIVWGGRLTSPAQMQRLEVVSLLLNLLMLAVVSVRAGFMGKGMPPRVTTVALWAMCGLFALNTVGNLLSQNELEQIIFTPLTAVLSLLCGWLAGARQPGVAK